MVETLPNNDSLQSNSPRTALFPFADKVKSARGESLNLPDAFKHPACPEHLRHVLLVIPPHSYPSPAELEIPKGINATTAQALEDIRGYIQRPLMIDDFVDKASREAWREAMKSESEDDITTRGKNTHSPKQFRYFLYQENKLRKNKIAAAFLAVEKILPIVAWADKDFYNSQAMWNTLFESVSKIWNDTTREGEYRKLQFIDNFEAFLMDVFARAIVIEGQIAQGTKSAETLPKHTLPEVRVYWEKYKEMIEAETLVQDDGQ